MAHADQSPGRSGQRSCLPCLAISPFVKRNHPVLRPRRVEKQAPLPTYVVSDVGFCVVLGQSRLSSQQEAPHPTEMRGAEALYYPATPSV